MSNMSYCRFHNTLQDLRDCSEHLAEPLSESEEEARVQLIKLCKWIAAKCEENE